VGIQPIIASLTCIPDQLQPRTTMLSKYRPTNLHRRVDIDLTLDDDEDESLGPPGRAISFFNGRTPGEVSDVLSSKFEPARRTTIDLTTSPSPGTEPKEMPDAEMSDAQPPIGYRKIVPGTEGPSRSNAIPSKQTKRPRTTSSADVRHPAARPRVREAKDELVEQGGGETLRMPYRGVMGKSNAGIVPGAIAKKISTAKSQVIAKSAGRLKSNAMAKSNASTSPNIAAGASARPHPSAAEASSVQFGPLPEVKVEPAAVKRAKKFTEWTAPEVPLAYDNISRLWEGYMEDFKDDHARYACVGHLCKIMDNPT
jgi:hypothetical protein